MDYIVCSTPSPSSNILQMQIGQMANSAATTQNLFFQQIGFEMQRKKVQEKHWIEFRNGQKKCLLTGGPRRGICAII